MIVSLPSAVCNLGSLPPVYVVWFVTLVAEVLLSGNVSVHRITLCFCLVFSLFLDLCLRLIKLHLDLHCFPKWFVTEDFSSMRDKIRLPFRHIRFQGLEALRQKGMEVWAFAQKFWTGVERLGCHGGDVKDIFNSGLDESLPHWEMELVRSLDFWNFSRYLQLRKEGKIIHHRQSPPAGAVSSPPPSSSQAQDPSLIPTLKQRSRRRRGARTPVVLSPVVLEGQIWWYWRTWLW